MLLTSSKAWAYAALLSAGGGATRNWDGDGIDPTQVASFKVRAANGGSPVSATSYSRLTVTSVGFANGAMNLQLQDGRSLGYDQVATFL